ncbi:MAG TPA: hypothetical protein VKR52_18900 [Terracidiphilus sp.]|nr:hypothetical protein [Terracidiphilus sp.]
MNLFQPNLRTKTTLQILDQPGILSWPGGGKIAVYFNLIELQDVENGTPGRRYSYGTLRFRDHVESSIVLLFLSRTRLTIVGGGIETAVSLYGLNSFTVTGPIVPIRAAEAIPQGTKEFAAA